MTNKRKLVSLHRNIARIDQEAKRTFGWFVRIRLEGKTHSKFFSDKKSGGKNVALLKAISWREKTRARLGKACPEPGGCPCCGHPPGIGGICLDK